MRGHKRKWNSARDDSIIKEGPKPQVTCAIARERMLWLSSQVWWRFVWFNCKSIKPKMETLMYNNPNAQPSQAIY